VGVGVGAFFALAPPRALIKTERFGATGG
jgi:hypothetical protein